VVWWFGRAPKRWKKGVIILIHKGCTGKNAPTTLESLSLTSWKSVCQTPWKNLKCGEIIEPKLEDTQCSFRANCTTTDKIFTHQKILEKSYEYVKDVYAYFVDLHNADNQALVKSFVAKCCRNTLLTSVISHPSEPEPNYRIKW